MSSLLSAEAATSTFRAYFERRNAGQVMSYLDPDEINQLAVMSSDLVKEATQIEKQLVATPSTPAKGEILDPRNFFADFDRSLTRFNLVASDLQGSASKWQSTAVEAQNLRSSRRSLLIFVAAALPSLLFLYVGYFVSLRNGLLNILEARVIEQASLDGSIEEISIR
jgi:hypothetical protein